MKRELSLFILLFLFCFRSYDSYGQTASQYHKEAAPSWLVQGDDGKFRAVFIYDREIKDISAKNYKEQKQDYLITKKWLKKLQAIHHVEIKYDDPNPEKYNIIAEATIPIAMHGMNCEYICSIEFDTNAHSAGLVFFNWRLKYTNQDPKVFSGIRTFENDFVGNQNLAWASMSPFIEETSISWFNAMKSR